MVCIQPRDERPERSRRRSQLRRGQRRPGGRPGRFVTRRLAGRCHTEEPDRRDQEQVDDVYRDASNTPRGLTERHEAKEEERCDLATDGDRQDQARPPHADRTGPAQEREPDAKAEEVRQSHERYGDSHRADRGAGIAVEGRNRDLDLRPIAASGTCATAPARRSLTGRAGRKTPDRRRQGSRLRHGFLSNWSLVHAPARHKARTLASRASAAQTLKHNDPHHQVGYGPTDRSITASSAATHAKT